MGSRVSRATATFAAVVVASLAPVAAAPLEDGDRIVRAAVSLADLDRGDYFGADLDTADGPALDVSIGWMRSRVFEVGLHASYLDLDVADSAPDPGSLSGFIYGGFLAMHVPTSGRLSPYGIVDVQLYAGDLGTPYEYGYGFGAGLAWLSEGGMGFDVRVQYDTLNGDVDTGDAGTPGRDFAPDADLLRISAGFVKRF